MEFKTLALWAGYAVFGLGAAAMLVIGAGLVLEMIWQLIRKIYGIVDLLIFIQKSRQFEAIVKPLLKEIQETYTLKWHHHRKIKELLKIENNHGPFAKGRRHGYLFRRKRQNEDSVGTGTL